jgi:acetolactate synthase regulatory subunit
MEVQFTHLGYASRTTTLILQAGKTVEINASMSAQPIELEPIEVTVRSAYLERNGFYRRSRLWGKQFTRADLDLINPTYLSDIIWRVPGVTVQRRGFQAVAVSGRGTSLSLGRCVLPVYVDGVRSFDADLDQFPPTWIEAMEVYHGISTPIQYGFNSCGVVLIWTR